ncbi:InlB B-repeat-containing protein [Breznakiella homolactica]|uniref:InlB B-repeat-containing protein n=1 Tax=Breznakiella homolactica TaxID=2798577 RepID=A0A7T8BA43_9SPIR|nr:InlB B-repeat-containing protein [Breznakiella homolactica]QQO08976.1 InlB B-repeat-containing protein [Breznakiella homolactica]
MKKNHLALFAMAIVLFLTAAFTAACSSPVSSPAEAPGGSGSDGGRPTTPDPVPSYYSITYNGNGNTAGSIPEDEATYESGKDIVTAAETGDLYKVGYRINGWNTSSSGGGIHYDSGSQFTMGDGPVTLYAQWEPVYPVVKAGQNFTLFLKEDRNLYVTGHGLYGRLGLGSEDIQYTPVQVPVSGRVRTFGAGWDSAAAVMEDGRMLAWGNNDYAKLGIGTENGNTSSPKEIASVNGTVSIANGLYHTLFLTGSGELWAVGSRINGSSGDGTAGNPAGSRNSNVNPSFVTDNVASAAAGHDYTMVVKKNGSLWSAGAPGNGRQGSGATQNVVFLAENTSMGMDNAKVFAGTETHTMVLKKDGSLWSTGNNDNRQLGIGSNSANSTSFKPVQEYVNGTDASGGTQDMKDVAEVSLGTIHSMILKNDGTLWAVGSNGDYRLGIQFSDARNAAFKVLDNVAHIAAGDNHTIAVKTDGTVWGAGANRTGQFGNGRDNTGRTWTEITEAQ